MNKPIILHMGNLLSANDYRKFNDFFKSIFTNVDALHVFAGDEHLISAIEYFMREYRRSNICVMPAPTDKFMGTQPYKFVRENDRKMVIEKLRPSFVLFYGGDENIVLDCQLCQQCEIPYVASPVMGEASKQVFEAATFNELNKDYIWDLKYKFSDQPIIALMNLHLTVNA